MRFVIAYVTRSPVGCGGGRGARAAATSSCSEDGGVPMGDVNVGYAHEERCRSGGAVVGLRAVQFLDGDDEGLVDVRVERPGVRADADELEQVAASGRSHDLRDAHAV